MRTLAVLMGFSVAAILVSVAAQRAVPRAHGPATPENPASFTREELEEFTSLEPIDTHTHIYQVAPAYTAMLLHLHLHILDIVDVSDNGDPERNSLDKEERDVFAVARNSRGHAAVCTSFDPFRIDDSQFARAAIARLDRSFDQGAIAVKLWKNVGMEIKDAQGRYILPDQPVLEPLYQFIAARHKTLLTHVADPDTAWERLGNQPDAPYYSEHPEWHM